MASPFQSGSHEDAIPRTGRARGLLSALAVFGAYLAVARLSLQFLIEPNGVVAFWPASGIALGALLLSDRRDWGWVIAGVAAANVANLALGGYPPLAGLLITLANVTESMLGAMLVRRGHGRSSILDSVGGVTWFVLLGAALPSAVGAVVGVAGLATTGRVSAPVEAWALWFVDDALGILVVTPFLLTLPRLGGVFGAAPRRRRLEAIGLGLAVLIASTAGFANWPLNLRQVVDLWYMPFPLLLWAALRFGLPGASMAGLVVAVIAVGATVQGAGPFADPPTAIRMANEQLFLAVFILTALLLAAVLEERRRALLDMRESEARYRILIEHAPEAVVVLDADTGRFWDFNRNALDLFGMTTEQLRAVGPVDLSPPLQPGGLPSARAAKAFIDLALREQTPVFEWMHCDARGNEIPCEVRLVRLPRSGRNLIRGSIVDIRERRQLEEELRHSQKMESVGRLAGGIAHDFNNLLTAILGNAELASARVPDEGPAREELDAIETAGRRAAALTQQLLGFARKQTQRRELLDLRDLVRQATVLLGRLLGERIEIRVEASPDPCSIMADPLLLEQVIVNLAVNARDAMPGGGRLTFAIDAVELGTEALPATPELAPGEWVRLRATDTGAGIDEKHLQFIFDPFFTTKPVGHGTGLGLATSYGIVKQSGGVITCSSRVGEGTTFSIFLPRQTARAPAL